jgi:Methylase involved in ubiquinone/menaquinone biosynthesis
MVEASPALKSEVKAFWNRQSCETQYAHSEKFTRAYFEQIEQWRYADQPFIHSFAQFTRYHGKKVLEVGFGAGTDFIQWLRAGAMASGIDLTEEALDNLTHRIQVYDLPEPESLKVGDAENLPFAANTFDLGYSWGVLHHTPDTEKAISELVRVIRSGGQMKIMLYNRHSLCAYRCWLKNAVFKGRPWKGLRWVLWNYIESVGTKGYTRKELQRMFARLPVTELRLETHLTSADLIARKQGPFGLLNWTLRFLNVLSGNRMGWFHLVAARKL